MDAAENGGPSPNAATLPDCYMTEKFPDDIFALCSRFDLDEESYRVFPKREPTTVTETVETEIQCVANSERALRVVARKDAEQENNNTSHQQSSRTALRNLWRQIELSENRAKIVNFNDLLKLSVFVYGTAGGVGSTTVTATLARLFSQNGRCCGVVDGRNESALPFFFGEQQAIFDGKQYAGLHAASQAAIRIITRKVQGTGSDRGEESNQGFWFEPSVSQLRAYLDHLIVDVEKGQEPTFPAATETVAVIVVIPDVSSLVGAKTLKRILSEKAPNSKLIYVLNKFDASVALHSEIKSWFDENFSSTLTLSRSDLVNEALAEGMTVVDWAPQSAVTADFYHLLTTVQNMIPLSSSSKRREEPSLCS